MYYIEVSVERTHSLDFFRRAHSPSVPSLCHAVNLRHRRCVAREKRLVLLRRTRAVRFFWISDSFVTDNLDDIDLPADKMTPIEWIYLFRRIMAVTCCVFGLPGNILTIIVCMKAFYRRTMNFERKVFDLYLAEISFLGKFQSRRSRAHSHV